MGSCNSGGKSNISESEQKPLGGDGTGDWEELITAYPFNISPSDVKAALGSKGKAISILEAVRGANPFYNGGSTVEFSENCQRSVIAFEARRRGYDVAALPTFKGDTLPSGRIWANAFENPQFVSVGSTSPTKTQQNLEKQMKSWGKGSRAIVSIPGHVFNCENVNGKIRYVDAQTNTVYNSNNVFSRVGKKSRSIQIMRTDNLKFSDNAKKSVTPVTETMRKIESNRLKRSKS